jgi:hypothetical protein
VTASVWALVVLSCACGSRHPQTAPPGPEEPETAVGALLPSGAAASSPSDDEQGSCDAAECPDVLLFGSLAAGCCVDEQACGGRVQIAERSWLCLPPGYDRNIDVLRTVLVAHAGQPLVPEPSCPSQTFEGSTLAGCCIPGGTCGVSTEPWTGAIAQLGQGLHSACILASEAARIAGSAEVDAGPSRACASPGSEHPASDAGCSDRLSPARSPQIPRAGAEQL